MRQPQSLKKLLPLSAILCYHSINPKVPRAFIRGVAAPLGRKPELSLMKNTERKENGIEEIRSALNKEEMEKDAGNAECV